MTAVQFDLTVRRKNQDAIVPQIMNKLNG